MATVAGRATWTRRLAPSTRAGRLACWLALAFVAWFVLNQVLVVLNQDVGDARVLFILWGWMGLGIGLAASVIAAFAVAKRHERGWLVYATILPGLFVLGFLVGELLFEH